MKLSVCLLILAVTLFSSCIQRAHRYVYASQAANINYFKQKGDSKITGYYSGDGNKKNDGLNIQAGYALTNHIALMAAYTHQQQHQVAGFDSINIYGGGIFGYVQTNIFDSSVVHYKRNTVELAAGYFFPLNHQKTVTYNLYGGVSFGKMSIADAGLDLNRMNYTRFYDVNLTKYFLQGSFNIMTINDLVHFSAGGKISFFNYHSFNTSYDSSELNYFYLDKINNKTFAIWEPFFNLQFSLPQYPWIKVDGQLSLTSGFRAEYPKVRTFNGSIGLTIEPTRLFKKKKN